MGKIAYMKNDPQTEKLDFNNLDWQSHPLKSISGKLIKSIQYWGLQGYFAYPDQKIID